MQKQRQKQNIILIIYEHSFFFILKTKSRLRKCMLTSAVTLTSILERLKNKKRNLMNESIIKLFCKIEFNHKRKSKLYKSIKSVKK